MSRIIIRIVATLFCAFATFFLIVLSGFIFSHLATEIFGLLGFWLPFITTGAAFVIAMLFIWKPFKVKTRRISAMVLAGAVILFAGVSYGYNAYQKNLDVDTNEGEMRLFNYEPFSENTLVASLDSESTLKLTCELPILDGATALYPLYSAFARATYPEGDYRVYDAEYIDKTNGGIRVNSPVICQSTGQAFTSLINGDTDIAFLMGISDEQQAAADALGVKLTLTPIGREAFVFFVNSRNNINGVSSDDICPAHLG
jgi:phosphate transport system substrate-binding protein